MCLVFQKYEHQYACKRYAYKKTCMLHSNQLIAPTNDPQLNENYFVQTTLQGGKTMKCFSSDHN